MAGYTLCLAEESPGSCQSAWAGPESQSEPSRVWVFNVLHVPLTAKIPLLLLWSAAHLSPLPTAWEWGAAGCVPGRKENLELFKTRNLQGISTASKPVPNQLNNGAGFECWPASAAASCSSLPRSAPAAAARTGLCRAPPPQRCHGGARGGSPRGRGQRRGLGGSAGPPPRTSCHCWISSGLASKEPR